MATEPGQAQKPTFVSATDSTLVLKMNLNVETRGVAVEQYELSVSSDGQSYTVITNYAGEAQFELDSFRDNLQAGQVYRLRVRAKNEIGWGEYSPDLLAAMTAVPQKPSTPTRDDLLSSKTSVAFSWSQTDDNPGELGGLVTGYRIYKARDFGQYTLILDAKDSRTLSSYVAEDLQTGGYYKFKVSAYNFNGEGPMSDALETHACVAPSKMLAP